MIYTYTLNPSVDYVMQIDTINFGETNRSKKELFKTGGKGINVSIVLNNLDTPTIAAGFLGGFSGNFIKEDLKQYKKIKTEFIQVNEPTRINIKLKGERETELNGSGQIIPKKQMNKLWEQFNMLPDDAFVILSGSLPQGLPKNFYSDVCFYLNQRGIKFIIDTTSENLFDIAKLNPVLLKPNQDELRALFKQEFASQEELILAGKKLLAAGAEHVIISLGANGSLLFSSAGNYYASVPGGTLVDSVGAGDSMIAGFTYGLVNNFPIVDCFRYAGACGSATAYSEGLTTKKMMQHLIEKIKITKI